MTNTTRKGKPDAGNPHVAPTLRYGGTGRFDEGEVASAKPRRGSLLYKGKMGIGARLTVLVAWIAGGAVADGGSIFLKSTPGKMFNKAGEYVTSGGSYYPPSWAAMMGHGWWTEDDAWQSDRTYVLGKALRLPQTQTAGTYPFPGGTLIVSNTLAWTGFSLPAVADIPHLIVAKGAFRNWSATANATLYGSRITGEVTLQGACTIASDAQNMGCCSGFEGTWKGASTASLTLSGPSTNNAGTVFATQKYQFHHVRIGSDTSAYAGSFTVKSNSVLQIKSVPGSVTVQNGGALEPYDESMTLSVGNLSLNAGSRLDVPFYGETAATACGRILVNGTCTVAGPVAVSIGVTNATALQAFRCGGTFPVLTCATGTLDPTQFVVGPCWVQGKTETTRAPRVALSVAPDAEGRSTLSVTITPQILCLDNTVSGNSSVDYYCQVTNAAAWSDGLLPHADADYVFAPTNTANGTYFRFPQAWMNAATNFPGDSLSMPENATIVLFGKPLDIPLLKMASGSRFYQWGANTELTGVLNVNADNAAGNVDVKMLHGVQLKISSAISGQGNLNVIGWIGSASPYGKVWLAGDNSAFTGKIKVSLNDKMTTSGSANIPVPTFATYFNTLYLGSAAALGGDLDAFRFDAFEIGGMSRVATKASFTIPAKSNRGVYVNWVGRFHTDAGQTLAIETDVTYHGRLVKEGAGMLALGGSARFGADGASTPEANSNLFEVAAGSFKPLSSTCLEGVAATLDAGAALVYDLVPADTTLKAKGLVGASLACTDATVGVALAGVEALPFAGETYTLGLFTGTSAACADLRNRLAVARPSQAKNYAAQKAIVENADGTYTLMLTLKPSGCLLIFR